MAIKEVDHRLTCLAALMNLTALTSVQQRFEKSAGGRILLSALIIVLVASIAAWNLPPAVGPDGGSALRRDAMQVGSPLLFALGLDQNWGVFAPPRVQTIALSAQIFYSNGHSKRWTPPTSTGNLFGAYRDYRWVKYLENIIQDSSSGDWPSLSAWLARTNSGPGQRPVSVTLTRYFSTIEPLTARNRQRIPGAPAAGSSAWQHDDFFNYPVPQSASPTR